MELAMWPWVAIATAVAGAIVLAYMLGVSVGRDRQRRDEARARRVAGSRRQVARPGSSPGNVRVMRVARESNMHI